MSTSTPHFDINTWNEAADAKLLAEFQDMAITLAGDLEKPKGYRTAAQYLGGVPTSVVVRPVEHKPLPPPARKSQQQRGMSRSIWFAVTGAFFAELPAVILASNENRTDAIGTMITNMGLAAVGAGATVIFVEALVQTLQGVCESMIPTTSMFAAYTTYGLVGVSVGAFVTNAFMSCWHLLGATLAQAPQTAEYKMKLFQECWSPDRLVSTCASGMAATATFMTCGAIFANPIVVGGAAAILHLTFCVLMDKVIEKKKDRGLTWGAWVRSLIVSDERARMWEADLFHLVEEAVTDKLICPITGHLIVDPVLYIRSSEEYIYERHAIYTYLKQHGKDYVSQKPASALDYKRSTVAAGLSTEIAKRYGATLAVVNNGVP